MSDSIIAGIKERYEGKELYSCRQSGIAGTRINLDPYCISFCHEAEIPDRPVEVTKVSDIKSFSFDKYYNAVNILLEKFQDDSYPCRKCSQCKKEEYHFEKIRYVTVCTSMYCNSKCIYCNSHTTKQERGYDPLPIIQEFEEHSTIDPECYFDWGGGEPTQNDFFEDSVTYFTSNGYWQRINTNAIEYSDAVYDALSADKTLLRISVDSGTDETYRIVKGTDSGRKVWDNIRRYCKNWGSSVYIKYNVFNMNSDEEEIEAFVNRCVESGVKNIIIDGEVSSYQSFKNYGPFYYTEKELSAAHHLHRLAEKNGIAVQISNYAYGTRPEYKGDKLVLPDRWYDNLDHKVLCNGIMVNTFAEIGQFLECFRNSKNMPVLFGAGKIGRLAAGVFDAEGIGYTHIDNRFADEHNADAALRRLAETRTETDILLTVCNFKDMLRQINEIKPNVRVYWIPERIYREYYESDSNLSASIS